MLSNSPRLGQILMALATASYTQAWDYDACICQTDISPVYQIPAFELGCSAWINSHSCKTTSIQPISKDLRESLRDLQLPKNSKIKLGYVGHWASSTDSARFLKLQVVPAIQKFGSYFDIDNTGCSSAKNPYVVLNTLKSIPRKIAQKIHFRGNQTLSTGMWDAALPGKTNFWATVNGNSLKVQFPSCEEFEEKGCWYGLQKRDQGFCWDSKAQKNKMLQCAKVDHLENYSYPTPNGRSSFHSKRMVKKSKWVQAIPQLKVVPFVMHLEFTSNLYPNQKRIYETTITSDSFDPLENLFNNELTLHILNVEAIVQKGRRTHEQIDFNFEGEAVAIQENRFYIADSTHSIALQKTEKNSKQNNPYLFRQLSFSSRDAAQSEIKEIQNDITHVLKLEAKNVEAPSLLWMFGLEAKPKR